jgi:hypothetical protein
VRPAGLRRAAVGAGTSLAALTIAIAVTLAACGGAGSTGGPSGGPPGAPSGAPSGGASLVPTVTAGPAALVSPVTGLLTKLDSEGLTKVRGFTLRTDDGTETAFMIGVLENGAQFPPGHLAEHMAMSSPVRVFFRDDGGTHVVYRIEDAP